MSPRREGPGSEDHVTRAFAEWLIAQGWTVSHARAGYDDPDLVAVHSSAGMLIAEVKGDLGDDNGTSLDIGYGQLLRRMREAPGARYALVVATKALKAALRVPEHVRARLGVEIFVVDLDGHVHGGSQYAGAAFDRPLRSDGAPHVKS